MKGEEIMDREEYIAKLELLYVGDRNALEEIILFYDELEKYKNNWNKLKEWAKSFTTDEFNYNFLVVRIIDILIKMQELETGDNND